MQAVHAASEDPDCELGAELKDNLLRCILQSLQSFGMWECVCQLNLQDERWPVPAADLVVSEDCSLTSQK